MTGVGAPSVHKLIKAFNNLKNIEKNENEPKIVEIIDLFKTINTGPQNRRRMFRAEEAINNAWAGISKKDQEDVLEILEEKEVLKMAELFGGQVIRWRF